MYTIINQRSYLFVVILLLTSWLLLAPISHAQSEPGLSMEVSTERIGVGQTFEVAVEVQDAFEMYGFDISLNFDPDAVEVVDVDDRIDNVQMGFGTFLDSGFQLMNLADNAAGTLRFAMTQVTPSPPKSGSGTLFVVTFRAKVAGATPQLAFDAAELGQPRGLLVESMEISAESPPVTIVSDPVDIQSTPIPTQDANSEAIASELDPTSDQPTATPILTTTTTVAASSEPTVQPTATLPATAAATATETAAAVATATATATAPTVATTTAAATAIPLPTMTPTQPAQSTPLPSLTVATEQPAAVVMTPTSIPPVAAVDAGVAAQPIGEQAVEQTVLLVDDAVDGTPRDESSLFIGLLAGIVVLGIALLGAIFALGRRSS